VLQLVSVPRVYSYTRFSTPEQAEGDSPRRQEAAAQAYAERHGLVLDSRLSISDLGVSAFMGANLDPQAGLGKFMDAVRAGLVEPGSILLLESLDRLSRAKPRAAVRLLEDIVDAGITVATLSDGQQYTAERLDSDPTAFMVAFMVALRAHEESAIKGRRVAAAWAEKRRKVRAGEAKRLTKRAPAWLRPEGDWWAVDEEKAATVRRIYRMTLDGMGEHKIAETFNREGVPVLGRGNGWQRSSVAKLLRNPAVIGQLVPGRIEHRDRRKVRVKEEPIEGAFPPIIERADWLAVRALKDGHAPAARGRGAGAPLANILGGLAQCPICGSAMTRVSKGKRKKAGKPKLVCTRAKRGAGCDYHGVPLDRVEAAVVGKGAWLVDNIPAGERGGELDAQAEELAGRIAGLEEHLRDLSEAVERTGPSRASAERLAKLGAEIDTAKADLEAVEERRRCVDGGLIRERAYDFASAAQEFDGEHREALNAALRVLFDGVTVDYPRGQLVFHWRQGGESVVPYEFGFKAEVGGFAVAAE
jgi:DNA invertase Pin-like site-specific DNA recombinase